MCPPGRAASALFSVVFLAAVSSSYCIPLDSDEPMDHTLRTSECSYLKMTDERQSNAFKMNGLTCCMCPAGHHYSGICNSSHPNTTQCILCESGTHIHWEPHLQKTCIEKKEVVCLPWMVYDRGTTTERDRCICPLGTIQRGRFCVTVKAVDTPTKMNTPMTKKTSTETSMTQRPSEKKPAISSESKQPRMKPPALVERSTAAVQPQKVPENFSAKETPDPPTDTTAGYPHTDVNMKVTQGNGTPQLTWLLAATGILVLLLACLLIVVLWKMCPCQTQNKSESNDNDTPMASLSPLLPCEASPKQGGHRGFSQVMSEDPETSASAGPIEVSPERCNNRVEAQNPEQDQATVGYPLQEAARNETFALNIATKFRDFPREEAKTLFRAIIGDHKSDRRLDEIERKYNGDAEMIYNFMKHAIDRKGRELTPEYLLDKVKETELLTFVEIVENEMNMFCIGTESCST